MYCFVLFVILFGFGCIVSHIVPSIIFGTFYLLVVHIIGKMVKKLDMISDIDDKRETLKVAIRIKDLWYVEKRDCNKHIG